MAFNTITAKHFTGQYHETSLPGGEGLYTFGTRWYDPKLARFVSADTIVPDPSVPQSLNRSAYAIGNPLRYTDPSGHMFCEDCTGGAGHYGGGGSSGGGTSGTGGGRPPGGSWSGGSSGSATRYAGGGGQSAFGGTFTSSQLNLITHYSQVYEVPWQVTADLLESEILLDTQAKDAAENLIMSLFPFFTYVRPNGAGPGVGNVHVVTAKSVSAYFAREYAGKPAMQLSWNTDPDWQTAFMLVRDDSNIQTVNAYVRQLADYRFGAHGNPLKTNHSDLTNWTTSDGIATWHAYRYGVVGVSPGASGFTSIGNFQSRQFDYSTSLRYGIMQGDGAAQSVLGSVNSFRYYFSQ